MDFFINPMSFSAAFPVPSDVVDKHLKLASLNQIKVLLFVMKNANGGISKTAASAALGLDESEVEDALLFWAQRGILNSSEETKAEDKKPVVIKAEKPSRSDVIQRGANDPKIMLLLREAQLKFGRNLKNNEASTLVWLYEDHGMDVSVILMLLQYAVNENRCNISFIEKTAVNWINQGVETIVDAERMIAEEAKKKLAWSVVERAFGIEKRKPSTKETELSNLWVNEWKVSPELLKTAYDTCIDSTAKLSFPYIAKLIEQWHKDGLKSSKEVKNAQKPEKKAQKKNDFAAYDLDLFEKMLNSDD